MLRVNANRTSVRTNRVVRNYPSPLRYVGYVMDADRERARGGVMNGNCQKQLWLEM